MYSFPSMSIMRLPAARSITSGVGRWAARIAVATPPGMVRIATRSSSQLTLRFPPAEFVHGDDEVEEVAIGPLGVLYTYTVVHPGKGVEPYALAMVDFEPGVRAFGRLCGPLQPAPAIDSTVRVVPFALADGTPD